MCAVWLSSWVDDQDYNYGYWHIMARHKGHLCGARTHWAVITTRPPHIEQIAATTCIPAAMAVVPRPEHCLRSNYRKCCIPFLLLLVAFPPFRYGCYTDDTEMTLALATSIIQQYAQAKLQAGLDKPIRSACLDGRACGLAYGAAFDPGRGYGGSTVKVGRSRLVNSAFLR